MSSNCQEEEKRRLIRY